MSGIKAFKESEARPGSMLIEHLEDVKVSIEYYLKNYDEELIRLAGLAGICHDIGKNHVDWQDYIDIKDDNRTRGPNHSDFGAFVFSYLGFYLLNQLDLWEEYQVEWLWFIRDIADHHGNLKDLSNDYWIKSYYWDKYDLRGMEKFIYELYVELKSIPINSQKLENWIDEIEKYLENTRYKLYSEKEDLEFFELAVELQRWRMLTTGLIMGDRFSIEGVESAWISEKDNYTYKKNIEDFCVKNQNKPLSVVRMKAQEYIMKELEENADGGFYTLSMPTGYGKTITSLKMASWFIEKQDYKKIVYVAPYLSILEQTSETIENAMGEKPLEHHSLAVIDENEEQGEGQKIGDSQLWMESWAHSIVCTSFNQFSKAIFPRRAQNVLRRSFLKDCIIIIDEPQIFDPNMWNLFLYGLEGLSNLLNLKTIFVSATMPPFDYGLSGRPINLEVGPMFKKERYKLYIEKEKKDEISLANLLKNNKVKSQVAILNTIEDAYRVYKKMDISDAYLLHGLMIPVHKKFIIKKIKGDLKSKKYPLHLVSTQVIEAGADVSFENVFRALPILPSIVQAAGRVNRHGEGEGNIKTFPFYRLSEKDTRRLIYPRELIEITDKLIGEKEVFGENELTDLVKEYYNIMFKQNTYEGSLKYLEDAYMGKWEKLSDFKPFSNEYLRLPIFIPWDTTEENFLDDRFKFLKDKFKIKYSSEIYERYSDYDYISKLSFQDRKQFMILFYHYVLNLPVKHALKVASKEDFLNSKIPKLDDSYAYDEKIGLKTPFEEYDNILL